MARKRLAAKKRGRTIEQEKDKKTSKNYEKIKSRLADVCAHGVHVRQGMAHRVSKQIAEKTPEVLVIEDLKIPNMVKRPAAKRDPETGKWLPNRARAKAKLTESILGTNWGRIVRYLDYKLTDRGKCCVKIPPHHSSQECEQCGYTSAENRLSQSDFYCQHCGHQANADENAAKVLKNRFLHALKTDQFVLPTKTVTKIALRKQKTAQTAVSVCGAEVKPILTIGAGDEAETFRQKPESLAL